jgi:hypothetical protein
MMLSTRERIEAEILRKKPPSFIQQKVLKDVGGLSRVKYAGQLPSMGTIYSTSSAAKDKNPFGTLLERAIEEQQRFSLNSQDNCRFIRAITVFPEHYVICFTDRQINDIKRFCTPEQGAVMFNVDTTFDVVRSYYATFTTYRHGCLLVKGRKNSPVLCGPVMFHQHAPNQALYGSFASTINRAACPNGLKIRFLGTDGDSVSIFGH